MSDRERVGDGAAPGTLARALVVWCVVALFVSPAAAGGAKIGVDHLTGKPITLPKGRKHPILRETQEKFAKSKEDKATAKKRLLDRKGDILDLDFAWDELTPAERTELSSWFRTNFYRRYGCSCNNGRLGAMHLWAFAIVLEDEELAAQVLSDVEHWLGHDTTCSGHSTDYRDYDYCYGAYPGYIAAFASYLEGLNVETLGAPAYPRWDSDRHDGFVVPFEGGKRENLVWKSFANFQRRALNICAPSGHVPPINDSSDYIYRHKDIGKIPTGFDLRSRNMRSEVVLLAGKLNSEVLWGKRAPIVQEPVPGEDTLYVLFDTAPTNDVHNHLDALQIILWRWGKFLLWDIGSDCAGDGYTYENGRYAHNTFSHNTVLIDQLPQLPTHPQVVFFGEVPGLKAVEADAGWTHDAAFHRRVLLMTDDYLLDVNYLRPRKGREQEVHDFDYMLFGPGTATIKPLGQTRRPRRKDDPSVEYYGAWPNLMVNYPYINWGEPYEAKGGVEAAWEYDGVGLRIVLPSNDFLRTCIGRAREAHYDQLGVAKFYAGYRGTSAQFFALLEPYQKKSRIAAFDRSDDTSCRVEFENGDVDYVLVNRETPRFVLVRTSKDGQVQSVRALGAKTVRLAADQIEADRRELDGLALEWDGAKLKLFAESAEAQTLLIPLGKATSAATAGKALGTNDGKIALQIQKGRTVLEIDLDKNPDIAPTRETMAKLVAESKPREPAEIVDPLYPHTSTLLWDEAYRRPFVYGDGAYWGEDGISPCSVAVSRDGKSVAYGSYKGFVDCFTDAGRRVWRKYTTGCVIEDYYHRGKGVAISPDGAYVAIGTTARLPATMGEYSTPAARRGAQTAGAQALLLDAKGQTVWEKGFPEDVIGVAIDARGSVLLATSKKVELVGKSGTATFSLDAAGPVDDIFLLDEGKGALYCTTSGLIVRLDGTGKELWRYETKWNMGIYTVVASADGKRVYAGRFDNHVVALDNKGKPDWEHFVEIPPVAMACSKDGKNMVVAGDGGRIYYFDASGKLRWTFQCASMCYGTAMSDDGKYISAVATCGTVYFLRSDGKLLSHNAVYTPEPVKCAISGDGRFTAVAGIGFDLLFFENVVEP